MFSTVGEEADIKLCRTMHLTYVDHLLLTVILKFSLNDSSMIKLDKVQFAIIHINTDTSGLLTRRLKSHMSCLCLCFV